MMPLSLTPTGRHVTIQKIRGGRRLRGRLNDLGLNLESQIQVIKNDNNGPLIIAVKDDSRLALGYGMAHQILVSDSKDTHSL